MNNKLYYFFENSFKNETLSQAFLIGNVSFDEIKEELYKIFNKFIFNKEINAEENPDLYILNEEKENLNKDGIVELLKKLSTTSQFNNNKIYVIDSFEKLNDASFNAILKTLEEPSENIYAFLITKNMDNINPTIVSRCQKVFISSGTEEENNNEYEEITDNLINNIEKHGLKTIALQSKIYKEIKDRDTFIGILKCMLNKYNDAIKNIINNVKTNDIIYMNNDINSISKKILVINNMINELGIGFNKNINIDKLIVEIWRCNNENSSNRI